MVSQGKQNRLASESSPYLRQHAGNPVDWYPWGNEALERAMGENKPIFLSIGYSACHWCHVMERESFEDASIAEFLNENFISIKVDREERPDIDAIYMNAVVAMTGRGGWPMSVFLTPDRRPFYGGTYWPPRARMGMPGFHDILKHVDHAWRERGEEVEKASDEMLRALASMSQPMGESQGLDAELWRRAVAGMDDAMDHELGGFGRAPKFPSAMSLRVLLRDFRRSGNAERLQFVTLTLDQMARGGMYDQLGGGFHRYSTDAHWLVPHFEKMLYDQALLVPAYIEAWQVIGEESFAWTARETLDYVLREMTSPEGGFYSTQDADTEGVEGRFFTWTAEQLDEALPAAEVGLVKRFFGVKAGGNWEGVSILHRPRNWEEAAASEGMDVAELRKRVATAREVLLEIRRKRVAPHLDDKQIVSWNGMMISAFAQASHALGEPKYLHAAQRAAEFLLKHLQDETGRLLHSFREDTARFPGFLDDYAGLANGLLDLFAASGEGRWLTEAIRLAEALLERFQAEDGGLYFAAVDEELIIRQQDTQDNATPSGSGLAATLLVRLAHLTNREDFAERGEGLLRRVSGQMRKAPLSTGQSMIALDDLLGPRKEIVLVGTKHEREAFMEVTRSQFLPGSLVLGVEAGTPAAELVEPLRPLLEGRLNESGVAYVCENQTCGLAIQSADELRARLEVH